MNRFLPFRMLAAALMLTSLTLLGCENEFEAPAEMTLQTKSAADVLPSGVRFVGMMDVQAMQQNPSFDPFANGDFEGDLSAHVQDLLDATGFDPREDVHQVFVAAATPGPDARPSFVAYADFDRDRLQAYVEERFGDEFARTHYKGVTVYATRNAEHTMAFALATDDMLVASPDLQAVHAMLDRLDGQGTSLKDDATTMALIARASGGKSAWFVVRDVGDDITRADHAEGDTMERDIAEIGRAVQDVAVGVSMLRDGVEGTFILWPRPGVSSSDVADLTNGVIAAMKATAAKDDAKLRTLDQVQVRRRGDEVHVSFSVDNAALGKS